MRDIGLVGDGKRKHDSAVTSTHHSAAEEMVVAGVPSPPRKHMRSARVSVIALVVKRVVKLVAREDPSGENPFFRYCDARSGEGLLPLDILLSKYDPDSLVNAVNQYDTKHDVHFDVKAVKELEEEPGESKLALLSFVGYPDIFDDWTPLSWAYEHKNKFRGFNAAVKAYRAIANSSPPRLSVILETVSATRPKRMEGPIEASAGNAGIEEEPYRSDGDESFIQAKDSLRLLSVSSELSPVSRAEDKEFVASEQESDVEIVKSRRRRGKGARKHVEPDPVDGDVAEEIAANATAQTHREEKAQQKRQARKAQKVKRAKQRTTSRKVSSNAEQDFLASRKTGTVAWGASLCFHPGDEGKSICRFCNHVVKMGGPLKTDGTRSYTTSNLVLHLNGPHKQTWLRIQEKLGGKDSDGVTSFIDTLCAVNTKDTKSAAKADASIQKLLLQGGVTHRVEVNLAFLAWLVDSQVPFNSIENDTFKTFLIHSKLMVDSSFKMKESLGVMLDIVKAEGRERLSKCPGVSLTFDLWTSIASSKYLIVTYHGVMLPTFERVHHVLDLIPVEGSSYGSLIAEILEARLARIDANVGGLSHILSLTSENGSNVKLARQLVGVDEVPCFAHGLKGVIDIVFGESGPEELIAKFQDDAAVADFFAMKAVCDVSRTTLWVRAEMENEDYLTTISDNVTRWDGKYLSLQRFLELKQAFQDSSKLIGYFNGRFEGKAKMPSDLFSSAFYRRLAACKEILFAFHTITLECQGEGVTAAAIPHFIWKLKKACKDDGSDFAKRLRGAVKERLEKMYITGNSTVVLEAALLDPRYSQEVRKNLAKAKLESVWAAVVARDPRRLSQQRGAASQRVSGGSPQCCRETPRREHGRVGGRASRTCGVI